ncbi:MAG TPA: methyltransferase domain-containing protein [Candidatus Nanoarchaeia archaeon]|nr:methyltransferase domain-containing protein [Candidatus Nanoarchaeia archaeon]
MLIFVVNRAHKELAIAEIESLTSMKGTETDGVYKLDIRWNKKFSRLAFTKQIWSDNRLVCDINKANKYQERRAHLLPAPHPAMSHPKIARVMVNLSKAKQILDPFCGAGGILIEAALCRIKAKGFDIDNRMIKRTETNLKHCGIKNVTIKQQDATTFTETAEAVVTDLPYAKNTKVSAPLDELYTAFFRNLKKNKIKRAVIGFPDTIDYKKFTKGFTIENEFTYYLHKSLSKKIVVMHRS